MSETWPNEDPHITALYAELDRIPAPPDAIDDYLEWGYDENPPADTYSRLFDVRKWTVSGPRYAEITVGAQQIADITEMDDGWRVETCRIDKWEMHIQVDDLLTADEARQLSAALLEAADELQAREATR